MKVVIVFHSVCGNTYLVARSFEKALRKAGHEVLLKRVTDSDWVEKPEATDKARAVLAEMRSLAEAKAADLQDADMILMGSPVYFGNVSAEVKAFMDSTGGLWFQSKLAGKKFAAFVSAGNTEGGGDLALQALHTYANYMGMLAVPLRVGILPGENINVLGVIQYSNGKFAEALDDKNSRIIENWARTF